MTEHMSSENMRIKKILFATDLSPASGRTFHYAAGLADAMGAEVSVLHVLEKLRPNAEIMVSTLLE